MERYTSRIKPTGDISRGEAVEWRHRLRRQSNAYLAGRAWHLHGKRQLHLSRLESGRPT